MRHYNLTWRLLLFAISKVGVLYYQTTKSIQKTPTPVPPNYPQLPPAFISVISLNWFDKCKFSFKQNNKKRLIVRSQGSNYLFRSDPRKISE